MRGGLKESWAPKNWCFWTVVLKKTLESPLDSKEIKSVNPKENQSRIFTGKTDVETETPILWPPDVKNWLLRKDPDAGKDWRKEDKGWDGGMASLTQWTWVWESSRSWWWTGRPAVLQSMGSQTVGLNGATELNWLLHKWLCWTCLNNLTWADSHRPELKKIKAELKHSWVMASL